MYPASSTLFSIPLGMDAHQQADKLRRQQPNARKGKQVYLNTLAVYAVHSYLAAMGVPTDLLASDSQDEIQAALMDAADLLVSGLGKLECTPVLPDETVVTIASPDADRIGCVAIKLDANLREAILVGFVPHWTSEILPLKEFQPLSTLLDYLETLKQQVNLRLWFHHIVTDRWKTLEELVDEMAGTLRQPVPMLAYRSTRTALPNTIPGLIDLFDTNPDRWTRLQVLGLLSCIAEADEQAIAFLTEIMQTTEDDEIRRQAAVTLGTIQPNHVRGGVRRARVLELGMQVQQHRLLLVVTVTPDVEDSIEIHLRLYPTTNQLLPAHLQLSILDELGNTFLEEETEGNDDWMQLLFHGNPGDRFSIELKLGEVGFKEAFVI